MQLEDYLEFEKTPEYERIRIKGHRIALEHVVDLYNAGVSADDIWKGDYPSLTPEEVYGVLAYYLHNKAEVDEYIQRGLELQRKLVEEFRKKPPSEVQLRIKALRQEIEQHPRLAP